MHELRNKDRITTRSGTLKAAAFIAFLGYGCHCLSFLFKGEIPPSILTHYLGLPCPTTGCMRSLQQLFLGNWREAWLWNPFTLVFLLLLASSIFYICMLAYRNQPLLLPRWLGGTWLATLAIAGVTKFILGNRWW